MNQFYHQSRSIALLLFFGLASPFLFAQTISQGPLSGSTFADDNSVGDFSFSVPGNAVASDNNRATASALLSLLHGETHYLKVTGFGFNIPALSTITGIEVEVERSAWDISILATVKDNSVRLVKAGSPVGNNKASSSSWNETDTYRTYGSDTDTWGTTWSAAEINATNFGIVFSAEIDGLLSLIPSARVDHIRITVSYQEFLPLHFLNFSAYAKNENEVLLDWTTGDNDEPATFIIQRSNDGMNWEDIFSMPAVVNYSATRKYSYVDNVPVGISRFYYRIKLRLRSRADLYTRITIADIQRQNLFSVFPNPAQGQVYISGKINTINLYSSTGQQIQVKVERLNATQSMINTSFLLPGLYILHADEKRRQLIIR